MTEARFRALIERRAITFSDCHGALRAIALGVCDYLAETTGCPTRLVRIQLRRAPSSPLWRICSRGRPCPSWVGTGRRCGNAVNHRGLGRVWSRAPLVHQTPNRIPAEEMAAMIEAMVGPVLFGVSQ